VTPSTHSHYAGFRRRLLAAMLDEMMLIVLITIFGILIFGGDYLDGPDQAVLSQALIDDDYAALINEFSRETPSEMFDTYSSFLIPAILTPLFWVTMMATPGKMLTSCSVVDARTHQPITVIQAIVRYISYIISAIPFGLGFLWIIWDKRKQGFHDKIAKTVVLEDGDDLSQYSLQELAGAH